MNKIKTTKRLNVDGRITASGIVISVDGTSFPLRFPGEIWRAYPKEHREVLKDNVVLASTLFVPQMLGVREVSYSTARPLAETFFFKNGIYDMPICALADGKPAMEYVKSFFEARQTFARNNVRMPSQSAQKKSAGRDAAIIPFSFGKESLLSAALAKELGLRPILVNVIEPSNEHEYAHKKGLIKKFEKEMGLRVYTVYNGPGLMRSGYFWKKKTELGWGLQTTEYALLCLPFAYYFDAKYIILGNEKSCDDILDGGMLTFKAGYDQHSDWTPQQTLLSSLVLGRPVEVFSFVEPLYELAITKILHTRYPRFGAYQMSCMADTPEAKHRRWCQNCTKCGYMFALLAACGVDTHALGFTENLFDARHAHIYKRFFSPQNPPLLYGSREELALAFLHAEHRGVRGASIDLFAKKMLKQYKKNEQTYARTYLGINNFRNISANLAKVTLAIYLRTLKSAIS